ncbi:hypothetical protein VPH35_053498 [Triticum aestivum]|uniref:E3 ubiquitin ligase PARAQUAT TOLERANCE 3-like n=1 Tax=Triticum aestivum TaxID=4565 RepID=UPI00162D3CE4|nr:E3 ubiquitin ligase PARAQUAT TOLERANCE 3-like [Triticum aestivum]
MAVYYRSMCSRDTFPLPVAAPSISVGELKGLIMETGRYGHGRTRGRSPRESITISNEQGEEYADDSALVLRNSTVVVRRRVAGPPADRIVLCPSDIPPLCPRSRQDSGGSSSNSASRSAGNQDDQAKATSAVIDNGRGAAHKGRAPPAGYVCHRCRIPGHFIQHCPTNGDSRFDFGRAPVPAPGPADESNDDGFPADLHCRICKEVMADAVVASKCCFNSFCDRCIRAHIVANCKCACGAKASADDLIPNPTLRTTISNILTARAGTASSGAGKQSSSAASNEVAAPTRQAQSPAASQESSSGSHASSKKGANSESEHSDGKSTSASAAHETADTAANHVDDQHGYSVPFAPACYDPFLGGMPWPADPSMYYGYAGMPYAYGGGYPMGSNAMGGNMTVPPQTRNDGGPYGYHGRKRTRADCEDQSFKRKCGGGRSQATLVLT